MKSLLPGETPDRIYAAKDIYAIRTGRNYQLVFPFSREAVAIVKSIPTAHFVPEMRGWSVQANRFRELDAGLQRLHRALEPRPSSDARSSTGVGAQARDRTLMPVSADLSVGCILPLKGAHVTVLGFGKPFVADQRYSAWGRPELAGAQVRYAYHRPATDAEIASWRSRQPEHDLEPDF